MADVQKLSTRRIRGILAVLKVAEAGSCADTFGYDDGDARKLYDAAIEGMAVLEEILEKRQAAHISARSLPLTGPGGRAFRWAIPPA